MVEVDPAVFQDSAAGRNPDAISREGRVVLRSLGRIGRASRHIKSGFVVRAVPVGRGVDDLVD